MPGVRHRAQLSCRAGFEFIALGAGDGDGHADQTRFESIAFCTADDGNAGGRSSSLRPRHAAPCVGARVALQRCPILRTGDYEFTALSYFCHFVVLTLGSSIGD